MELAAGAAAVWIDSAVELRVAVAAAESQGSPVGSLVASEKAGRLVGLDKQAAVSIEKVLAWQEHRSAVGTMLRGLEEVVVAHYAVELQTALRRVVVALASRQYLQAQLKCY